MQAILILAHKNIDQVTKLATILNNNFEVYIHFDKKMNIPKNYKQILDKKTLREKWHLDGPFEYAVEGRPGTSFGNKCEGEPIQPTDNSDYKLSVSAHGHLPVKGPQPTFYMAGPHICAGLTMEEGRLIDEAPTWSALLGAAMPQAQGRALTELIRQ